MRRLVEKVVFLACWAGTIVLVSAVVVLLGYLCYRGYPRMDVGLFFGDVPVRDAILGSIPVFDGLYPALVGTTLLVVLATIVAVPLGVAVGIYLAEYAEGRWKRALSLSFDILAGLPSIVIGLAGFSLTIFLHKIFPNSLSQSLLLSALALAFLVLPYIIRSTQTALESCPIALRVTALSFGATKIQNITKVLVPNQLSKILGGVVLAMGRIAEDTAVIMLTGVVASAGLPRSLFEQFEAIPFYIYYISSQYTDMDELQMGFSAALVLLMVCSLLFVVAHFLGQYVSSRLTR